LFQFTTKTGVPIQFTCYFWALLTCSDFSASLKLRPMSSIISHLSDG